MAFEIRSTAQTTANLLVFARRKGFDSEICREDDALILFSSTTRELAPVLEFQSRNSSAAELATGSGEAHIHVVQIDAGGEIGPHVAGFGQLFVCIEGNGWVAAADGERVSISPGQVAYFARGERHSKGSASGLRALVVQVSDLHLCDSRVDQ